MVDPRIHQLGDYLLGTCNSIEQALDHFDWSDLDPNDVEDHLLDLPSGIERCKGCGWWHESCELATDDEDDETGYCDQCRGDEKQ